ncbi:CRISPR-associated ring nuclease Csm6 [Chitinilyticum piscinae]|uniref:TIGR02584 family CRISPR-associated protein n=1 Tax=Chitinilyticum piscinae TaxID=2866724 RepID=A0A8J7FRA1_9NEIS|nr:CRISPR-associated ring nuclease Csm6 [Chitinilyticum piscinae]MBE9610829.1 TIGR02584 family CRISPR-associated protein [Chitinilyticum piscinae]
MTTNSRRKILLVVSGMSPQIVTETLYALITRADNPWIPDEIQVLSTRDGCDHAKAELLHPSRNKFGQFCADYLPEGKSIKFDETCFMTFKNGTEVLNDIKNLEDSAAVADAIAAKVWDLTKDEATEIHASIAGGRKSMGFLLGYAMSLYGRPQDRLSHVLVSEDFESSRDFYFPPKQAVIVHGRNDKPLDTSAAQVMLAEIPILYLRKRIPAALKNRPASFSELVSSMNIGMENPSIEIRIEYKNKRHAGRLQCHGKEIPLSPIDFSTYLFILKKMAEVREFNWLDITVDEWVEIKSFGDLVGDDFEDEYIRQFDAGADDRAQFFYQRKNAIKEKLEQVLGDYGDRYLIKTIRGKGHYIDISGVDVTINGEIFPGVES